MKAFIGARAIIPTHLLTASEITKARHKLTFTSITVDSISQLIKFENDEINENEIYEDDTGEDHHHEPEGLKVVNEFRYGPLNRYVSLPREWAVKAFPHIKFEDRTSLGTYGLKFDHGIKPRDEAQRKFFHELRKQMSVPGPINMLANATTGAGKSVASVWLALEFGVASLVIVDSNKLKNQYVNLLKRLMGAAWVKKYVGIVQQDECDYEGRAIVIGMVQTLASRGYDRDFYDYFGFIDYDEVQIFGSAGYSPVLSQFSAKRRLGLTATNKKGEFGKLIVSHLGTTKIVSKQEVLKPRVFIVNNTINRTFRCDNDGVLINGLSYLTDRNARLSKIIKFQGYDRDRVCLVLSNRIKQLQDIQQNLVGMGVPEHLVGLHVGSYETSRFDVFYQYGPKGKRQRLCTEESYSRARTLYNRLQRNPEHLFVINDEAPLALLKEYEKDTAKWQSVMFSTDREQYVPTNIELDNITNSCQIILATYEIFSKGVDVPRIDWGIECIPAGNVTQPLGRVLRLMEGKAIPEWISFRDHIDVGDDAEPGTTRVANAINHWLENKYETRMRGFIKSGATIRVI